VEDDQPIGVAIGIATVHGRMRILTVIEDNGLTAETAEAAEKNIEPSRRSLRAPR
jgi:hypothetical protein